MKEVYLYDTTLRDGEQAEEISFSSEDKVRVARILDELGMDYIEGGWPGSNDKAEYFFKEMKGIKLHHARLAPFGSTRLKGIKAENDRNLNALLEASTPAVTIFGKTWDLHVREALRVSPEENLAMISDSVRYLKSKHKEVIYDAEHFFDGYKSNPVYALKTLAAAAEAGADCLVLCDTNGGSLPMEVGTIVAKVKAATTTPLGIHTHNDGGCGVANALVAVAAGACHVQGTVNGYGERCGNSDLIQIIPNLVYKLKKSCMPPSSVKRLTEIAHTIAEVVNQIPDPRQPFVGRNVYTHKGGIHVSAVRRNPITYEHLDPDLVGNRRRVVVSEQSGGSNLLYKAEEIGIDFSNASEETRTLLREIKKLEHEGYQFEAAEGSLEVMMKKALKQHRPFFELDGFRVIIEKRGHDAECLTEATIKLRVGGEQKIMAAEGDGPVNALDNALRKALLDVYPALRKVHLSDFKVRVLNAAQGTAAKVRVLITTTDGKREWGTVGVSENIIQACWRALVDSLDYTLMKDMESKAKRAGNKKAKAKAVKAAS